MADWNIFKKNTKVSNILIFGSLALLAFGWYRQNIYEKDEEKSRVSRAAIGFGAIGLGFGLLSTSKE